MDELDRLRAAGWEVIDAPDHIRIRWGESVNAAYAMVMKNPDGSLHLVKQRSAFHRDLASILNAPAPMSGDYEPRRYGQ